MPNTDSRPVATALNDLNNMSDLRLQLLLEGRAAQRRNEFGPTVGFPAMFDEAELPTLSGVLPGVLDNSATRLSGSESRLIDLFAPPGFAVAAGSVSEPMCRGR